MRYLGLHPWAVALLLFVVLVVPVIALIIDRRHPTKYFWPIFIVLWVVGLSIWAYVLGAFSPLAIITDVIAITAAIGLTNLNRNFFEKK